MHIERKVHQYNLSVYDFSGRVQELLGGTALDATHTAHSADRTKMHDQNTTAHALFYHRFDLIRPLYEKFIETQIMPLFDDDLCVQTVPTFRLSMPGGMAVQEFHRDGDYHHQASTVNFWLPLTKAFATNTVWIESEPDTGDFAPVNLDIGQYLEFDAIKLRHGNVPNETGVSRVSFDFRVIPRRYYHDTDLRTVTNDTRLALGSYYSLFRRPDH